MKFPKFMTLFFILAASFVILFTEHPLAPKSYAQQPCTASTLNQGLISALSVSGAGMGNSDQTCVVDPQAAYRDFKVPSFSDLENQFYSTSKSTAKRSSQLQNGNIDFGTSGTSGIYLQDASMTVSSVTGSGVQIVFIRGNLEITGNIDYADTDAYSGLVFVVSGDINIDSSVTKVNAVLISSGIICTAYVSPSCSDGITITPQLTVNGSLISINKTDLPNPLTAIQFTRNLALNNQAAEVINKQAKYLYILRGGLFTEDLIITQEDTNYAVTADPGNPTPPTPPTLQAGCPGSTNPLVIAAAVIGIDASCVLAI